MTSLPLGVMDGFVNEFESVRRGLHAREAEELDAWDCVVGHHEGLTKAHRTFTKGKSVTSDEPVHELYRSGIVHGTLLNYDNDVVSTKAWNRLFAVMDWAKATELEKQPKKPQATWSELWSLLKDNAEQKRATDAWRPQQLTSDDAAFKHHPAVVACERYLTLWQQRNYGGMAALTSHDVRKAYGSKLPRAINQEYSPLSWMPLTFKPSTSQQRPSARSTQRLLSPEQKPSPP